MSGWNTEELFVVFAAVAVKSTAVLAAAWLAALLLRRRSAAARHLVWTGAAAAILSLPLLSVSLPAVRVPGVGGLLPATASATFSADASAPAAPASRGATERRTGAAPGSGVGLPNARTAVMLLWVAGVAAVLVRMFAAWLILRRIRRSAKPLSDNGLGEAIAHALGIRHAVDLLETERSAMPMTFGILRPAVFLPSDAATWSEERRRIVLLHELAHVRRGDASTQLLARIAFALCWWNPLAWTGWRAFLKERERATDDMVLNAGARASEYASHLLEVARAARGAPAIGWAAVTMARRPQIESRLGAILDARIRRKSTGPGSVIVAVALAVALTAPLAAVRAQAKEPLPAEGAPADVEVAIRAAVSQRNHEMLESAAKAAEQSRRYELAQKLLEAAAAIRAEVSGEGSASHGIGLLKLAEIEGRRGMSQMAEAHYAQAARILGERPEAAGALLRLGTAALIKKEFAAAIDYFERARRTDSRRAGIALMWLGVVRQQEGNIGEAERCYQTALAGQDPKAPEAVTIGRVYSGFLRQQGRNEEAGDIEARTAEWQRANAVSVRRSSAGVHRIGGAVKPPLLVHKQEPEYSEEARAARLEGSVVLYAEVGVDGLTHNVQVVRGLGLGLDENAVDAVSQWRFEPGLREGRPVTVAATIEVNYRLL